MTNNVYAAPVGNVVVDEQAYAEVSFFSPSSRINRLRYWAHITLAAYGFCVCVGIAVVLGLSAAPAVGFVIGGITYLAFFVFSVIVGIQRLHDIDKSGWLWLLNFVPIANIYVMILVIFFPGTLGENRFGLPAPPSKTWHWVVALSFPVLIAVIGIVSAVAAPKLAAFNERANAAEVMPMPEAMPMPEGN